MNVTVLISRSVPTKVDAIGVPVASTGVVPRSLGHNRAALEKVGFEGKQKEGLSVQIRLRGAQALEPDAILFTQLGLEIGVGGERNS